MKLRIGICEFEHMMTIERQPAQALQDIRDSLSDSLETRQVLRDHSATLFEDDEPIGCLGIMPMWKGVGSGWGVLSARILEHPRFLTDSALDLIAYAEEVCDYHRIEAAVAVDHAAAHRWIRRLGFEYEGNMVNYGLGGVGNFSRYARLR